MAHLLFSVAALVLRVLRSVEEGGLDRVQLALVQAKFFAHLAVADSAIGLASEGTAKLRELVPRHRHLACLECFLQRAGGHLPTALRVALLLPQGSENSIPLVRELLFERLLRLLGERSTSTRALLRDSELGL